MTIRQLDDWTFIGGQIHPDEVAGLAQMGVTLIVNHRPDGEVPSGRRVQKLAAVVHGNLDRPGERAGEGAH